MGVWHVLPIHGQAGSIRWGYRLAAQLGAWSLTTDRGTADHPAPVRRLLRAAVLEVDLLSLRQAGLRLVVPRPKGALTWPVLEVSLDRNGQALTALLGPFSKEA